MERKIITNEQKIIKEQRNYYERLLGGEDVKLKENLTIRKDK